jgi:hypothetical protein
MNVTLKLPDDLVREARHLAIDEGTSLSAVVADLLSRKLNERRTPPRKAPGLAESLLLPEEPAWFAESGFPLEERGSVPFRGTPFGFERDPDE